MQLMTVTTLRQYYIQGSRDSTVVRALISHAYASWVWFLEFTPYACLLCYWFSSLLQGLFSGYSGFPLSIKTKISNNKLVPIQIKETLLGFPLKFPFILFPIYCLISSTNSNYIHQKTYRVFKTVLLNILFSNVALTQVFFSDNIIF